MGSRALLGDRCELAGPKPGSSGRISCKYRVRWDAGAGRGCRLARGARPPRTDGTRAGLASCARVGRPAAALLRQAAGCSKVSNYEEGDVRVSTAFNRMLGLAGAWVRDVVFGSEAVIVTVVLRAEKPVCSGCGARGLGVKEHRTKRWRALDLGACRCVVVPAQTAVLPGLRRRVRGGAVGQGRREVHARVRRSGCVAGAADEPDAGHEVAADRLEVGRQHPRARRHRQARHRGRLDGLVWIGCDEISYGAEHKFLTCVADHQQGRIVWAAPGRNAKTLQAFFDGLTDEQRSSIKAVSIDMSAGYEKAIRDSVPDARVCFDPFHVVQLGSKATDQVRRAEYNKHGRSGSDTGKWIKGVRYSLLKDPAKQTIQQLLRLCEVQQTNKHMFRAALLYGELRYVYKVPKDQTTERLDAWLSWASRSRLKPFVKLARTIRKTQSRR